MIETIEKEYVISQFMHFKWKFKSLWPICILTALEILLMVGCFIFMGVRIWYNELDNLCFTLFCVVLIISLILPANIYSIEYFSNKILFEKVKVKIDVINRTITVVSENKKGNFLTTVNNIAYRKEKNKYFLIGDTSLKFFFVPKAGLKKDEIKIIRSIKLREPLNPGVRRGRYGRW